MPMDGALEIYEYSGRRRELMHHINGGGQWHVLPGRDGKGGIHSTEGPPRLVCRQPRAKALPCDEPDSRRIPGLFSKVKGYTGFELSSRAENEDIYRLLSIEGARLHEYSMTGRSPITGNCFPWPNGSKR